MGDEFAVPDPTVDRAGHPAVHSYSNASLRRTAFFLGCGFMGAVPAPSALARVIWATLLTLTLAVLLVYAARLDGGRWFRHF